MLEDLRKAGKDIHLTCDLCIVGSGAAGLALASEFISSKQRILILESGAFIPETAIQALYDCVVPERDFAHFMDGRFRLVGGSTTQWGGQALPLDNLDFLRRDWVSASGWPLKLEDLLPYYVRAGTFLDLATGNFGSDVCRRLKFTPPQFDPELILFHFSKWSPRPDLRGTYIAAIARSPNVILMAHANLTGIALTPALDQVSSLTARSLEGTQLTVTPKHTALCVGGIETPRILLSNDRQCVAGIGNANGLVGRYFQDHPGGCVGFFETQSPDTLQRFFNTFYRGGLKYAPRFSIAEHAQQNLRILNVSGYIQFDAGAGTPYERAKNAISSLKRRSKRWRAVSDLARASLGLRSIVQPAFEYIVRGRGYAPNPAMRLIVNSEQEPDPESRITLSDERDVFGVPKPKIRWHLTALTQITVWRYCEILQREFLRLGLGRIDLDQRFSCERAAWRECLKDQCHHMGTTRMSASARNGVVDRNGRVHGISNLWVAGSAVFPTGGHSNPTLTIIALTIRMADDLKKTFA